MIRYQDIKDLDDKVIVITGGTSGIGKEALLFFLKKKATCYFLGSNLNKGNALIDQVKKVIPDAKIYFYQCDQLSLEEVRRVSKELLSTLSRIDILINNAGIMRNPKRELSPDNIESQMAINYVSHYLLTYLLIPLLSKGNNPRIINVSSIAAKGAKYDYNHFNDYKKYKPSVVYSNTKLAMLSFGVFLGRLFKERNVDIKSIIVHPGVSKTALFTRYESKFLKLGSFFISLISQSPFAGSLPLILGAVDEDVSNLDFIGPKGVGQIKGYPKKLKLYKKGINQKTIDFLIDGAFSITGVNYLTLNFAELSKQKEVNKPLEEKEEN